MIGEVVTVNDAGIIVRGDVYKRQVLTCLIFISASMGPALNGTLTVASVLFNFFMNALELLVAFIQAYVFTMLSACLLYTSRCV